MTWSAVIDCITDSACEPCSWDTAQILFSISPPLLHIKHIWKPANFVLNVPFLALLSDLDVLDIQLEIRQQNPTALVLHASAFSEFLIVAFHLSQDSSAFIIFIFFSPTWTMFRGRSQAHRRFSFEEKKHIWKEPEELSNTLRLKLQGGKYNTGCPFCVCREVYWYY